jgi:RimJ/RimL family protein N-acetyltransferase
MKADGKGRIRRFVRINGKRSGRVVLRELLGRDAQALAAAANDPKVAASVAGAGKFPHPYTVGNAKSFIRQAGIEAADGSAYHLGVILKGSKKLIGMTMINGLNGAGGHEIPGRIAMIGTGLARSSERGGEIGYWLNSAYWGRGYASEAVGMLIAFAFRKLGLDYIYGITFSCNKRSIMLLRRHGFMKGPDMQLLPKTEGKKGMAAVYILREKWLRQAAVPLKQGKEAAF